MTRTYDQGPFEIKRETNRVPVLSWLPEEEIEEGALRQIENAAKHPDVSAHIAIMPDVHQGFGVTIGSVFPTEGVVVPNAVGVDIGCGVTAMKTTLQYDFSLMGRAFWRKWSGKVQREVPVGFNVHKDRRLKDLGALAEPLRATDLNPVLRTKAPVQLGTLGGGNHFLEAQADQFGMIWLMVHSGSRHTGLRIANHYHKLAEALDERPETDKADGLSGLPLDDDIGQDYVHDHLWAKQFAKRSRGLMISRMLEALEAMGQDAEIAHLIDCSHNYVTDEDHDGQTHMVHRKGATSAEAGEEGIIPGTMGSTSYIVLGKGNPQSLNSCSHGAGRKMGRSVAKKTFTRQDFDAAMAASGSFTKVSMGVIDEAPMAYKDVTEVIARQKSLIDVLYTLRPLMTIKGDSKARDD